MKMLSLADGILIVCMMHLCHIKDLLEVFCLYFLKILENIKRLIKKIKSRVISYENILSQLGGLG